MITKSAGMDQDNPGKPFYNEKRKTRWDMTP